MNILTETKTNAPRRSDEGAKMWACPSYTGGSPSVVNPAGCADCSMAATHNVAQDIVVDVPVGTTGGRYGLIPHAERQDAPNLHRIQAALWTWYFYLYGYIGGGALFNAGEAGDNADQFWTYEIVDAGAGYIDVKGPNPKCLTVGATRLNPEWPGPDPITGETSRIVSEARVGIMQPCAAAVEFASPSALAGKCQPLATKIIPPTSNEPDGVTFRLEFGDGFDASNATEMFDAGLTPPAKYYCNVRFEFLRTQGWKDYQAPIETQFARRVVTLSGAVEHALLDSEGDPCRVLHPAIVPDAVTAVFTPALEVDLGARVETVWDEDHWETTLDLSGLTFTSAEVTFWAEARDGDTERVICQGQCSRARLDPTGSYVHEGGPRHCGKTESSGFQAGLFHQSCWLPGRCDGFTLEDESLSTVGNDPWHLARLWTQAAWVLEQGVPGGSSINNFRFALKGGPSIEGICGSACDQVYTGFFARRFEWFQRVMGKRLAWTDNTGGQRHALVHGAFYLSAYDFSGDGGGPKYEPDAAASTRTLGIIAEQVSGWTTGKPTALRGFPWRLAGATNVYSYDGAGHTTESVNVAVDSEAYIVAANVAAVEEPDVVTRMRGVYA